MSTLLEIEDLAVSFGPTAAVRGASLSVRRGETHCLVGESGCGKSVTAFAVMNLLAVGARRSAARLNFDGVGVPKNQTQAVLLFDRACKMSDAQGCANLGYMFSKGLGVPKDGARAISLYESACNHNDPYGWGMSHRMLNS